MNLKSFEYYITTLNEEKNIKACIDSILESGGNNITVLDGGSSDKTEEISKECGAKFISFPNTSLSYRKAYIIEEAKADFIFLVDADNRLINSNTPNEEIVINHFKKDNQLAGVVYSKIPGSSRQNYWEKGFALRHSIVQGGENVKVIGSPCVFRSDYAKQVGFNSELAGTCDDTVFCDRLIDAGFTLKTMPENALELVRASLKATVQKAFWYGKGDSEYVTLYRTKRYRHLFHVLIRGPIIYPLSVGKTRPNLVPFFLIFGLSRVVGLIYGLLVKPNLASASS